MLSLNFTDLSSLNSVLVHLWEGGQTQIIDRQNRVIVFHWFYLRCELIYNKTLVIHLKHASWLHMRLHYSKYANEDESNAEILLE